MNKTIVTVLAAVVILGGGYLLFANMGMAPGDNNSSSSTSSSGGTSKASMVPYSSATYKLAFEYPSNLYLKERQAGTATRPQLSVVLVEDTEENRDVLDGKISDGREGPISINVDVYQNPGSLTSAEWAEEETNWTVATGNTTPITVAGQSGVSFPWSGLYEGKTVVVTKGNLAYVFSVSWMTPNDQLIRDFDMILNSAEFE